MPAISVIVPVYKAEPYLRCCVDSILNQTFTDFELILVDDGSPDNCPAICDEYAAKDRRVRVIHKENGGASSARNAGLDIAEGIFVTFADSDDWVTESYIQSLMVSDADLVCQTAVSLFEDGQPEIRHHLKEVKVEAETKSVIRLLQQGAFNFTCCKRFNNALIRQNNIRFCTDLDFAEDTLFVVQYAKCCNTIEVQDTANYRYVRYASRETLSGTYDLRRMEAIKRANRRIAAELAEENSARERKIFCERMISPYVAHINNYVLDGRFTMRQEAEFLFSLSGDEDFSAVAKSAAEPFLPLVLWRGLIYGRRPDIELFLVWSKLSEFKHRILAKRG